MTRANAIQGCNLEITSLVNGATVHNKALVEGKGNIPDNTHLWVFAHLKGFNRWWPQGAGEAGILDGRWSAQAFFGEPGELGQFEVVAMVVDHQTDRNLKKWVEEGSNKGIILPDPVKECSVKKITVEKVGN